MPDRSHDPMNDIYQMMDDAGLNMATLMNSKKPMPQIMNGVRTNLNMALRSYIKRRDEHMFNAGVKKGESKNDIQAKR